MTIYLTNSISRQKEKFAPIDASNVRMYVCGPTVYDRPHLGNARAAVVYDVLFRVLKHEYPKVTYVRNITDVDDKIIAASNERNIPVKSITKMYEEYYNEDMRALNCLMPSYTPRATEYIVKMLGMISDLIEKGYAYEAEGHVLFRVKKFAKYGQLSGRTVEEMISGARVEVAPYKEESVDFVLWKPSKKGEEGASFPSPWGNGRPGWHIECSAMSKSLLGDTFDIHGGGVDLIFPHHENEVAQSVCANDKPFANYWIHNGFLMVNGEKMSKSLGNFRTVRELIDQRVDGVIVRYVYMTTHYKKPLDFTDKIVEDASKAIQKFRSLLEEKDDIEPIECMEIVEALNDDLNTPLAISIMHKLASENKLAELKFACEFLGLEIGAVDIPSDIVDLAEKRNQYKLERNWKMADEMRDAILEKGFEIKDSKDGYKIEKSKTAKIARQNTMSM